MGSLFRSEEMTLCQLFLQSESAYACVSELGELGLVQFRDLNPDVNAFQRKFVNEVRRCDEMERKLRFLEKEIKKDGIAMMSFGDNPEAPQPREMIDLEATFEKLENELREVNTNAEALKKTYLELTELKHILRKTQQFFDEMHDPNMQEESVNLLGEEGLRSGGQALKLGFVAGVILRERLPAFERMLWRVCHGNVFLRQADIDTPLEDPVTGDQVYKSVFIIFFQGDQLKTRVKKICEGFRATLYPCPETPADRREMSIGVMTRIEDLNTVLGQTQDHRYRVLVAAAKNIKSWFVKVRKIKAIYHTLNLFNLDVTQKCLIAECWCACSDLDKIQMALCRGTEICGGSVPSILHRMQTGEIPPTFNRTNKFSQGFQNIVDAYGVASYREVNPALFTIITFPFLFAVMFGDAGHGLIMTLFAAWMVLKEKGLASERTDNEIWLTFFNGRYIILLMGTFSIYTGIIYNDIFSKAFNLFGSSWYPHVNFGKGPLPKLYQLDPTNNTDYLGIPYPFGVDPVWQIASNKILFLNSYKMKASVILGVSQMVFGVVLGLWNHRYFKQPLNVICEFVPQLIFLISIFGYLVLLIFSKWTNYDATMAGCAPSLLIMLINMFLFKYPSEPCYLRNMYAGQSVFQGMLVVIALLCIPWMLVSKPYMMYRLWKRRPVQMNGNQGVTEDGNVGDGVVQEIQPAESAVAENFDVGAARAAPPSTRPPALRPDDSTEDGIRFGNSPFSRQEFAKNSEFLESITERSVFNLEFKTSGDSGVLFYVVEGFTRTDFMGLLMKEGKLVFVFDCGTGVALISSANRYNDGAWHHVVFTREGQEGRLIVDDLEEVTGSTPDTNTRINVVSPFFVGGLSEEAAREANNNLLGVKASFPGCIRQIRAQGEIWTPEKQSAAFHITCCSRRARQEEAVFSADDSDLEPDLEPRTDGIEEGVRFGMSRFSRVEVQKDVDFVESLLDNSVVALEFKTSSYSGVLFYAEEGNDYVDYIGLIMKDGKLVLVFDCGTGHAYISSKNTYNDGRWHQVLFSHQGRNGRMVVDGKDEVRGASHGNAYRLRLRSPFYVGGVTQELGRKSLGNLKTIYYSFPGCLRKVEVQSELWSLEAPNAAFNTESCSRMIERNPFFSTDRKHPGLCFGVMPPHSEEPPQPPETLMEIEHVAQCVLPLHPLPDHTVHPEDGVRFGTTPFSRQEFAKNLDFIESIADDSVFSLEFKTTAERGVLFYIGEGVVRIDYLGLFMKEGKIIYVYDHQSGAAFISSRNTYNDGQWHHVVFSRQNREGQMVIDEKDLVKGSSYGHATQVDVKSPFYVGGLSEQVAKKAKNHLKHVYTSFPGCIRNVEAQGEKWDMDKPTLSQNTTGCTNLVEDGSFFSSKGGYLVLYEKYRVGQRKTIYLEIKPRSISGVLMAVHGNKDYLILQMIGGSVEFTVDNGNGPVTAIFTPGDESHLCDGEFHVIRATTSSNNHVSLSVDNVVSENGLGISGISSTDTYNPLYVGGVPESYSSMKGVKTKERFVGCIRNLQLDQVQQVMLMGKLYGEASLSTCPTT